MLAFGIIGSIFWPVVREYNYAAFFVSWITSMIYKYLHKGREQENNENEETEMNSVKKEEENETYV